MASSAGGHEAALGEVNYKGRRWMQGRPESARGMRARWTDGQIWQRETWGGLDTVGMEVREALATGGEVDQ